MNKLSIVVPVYNEEKNIDEFLNRTVSTIDKLNCDYEIIFALDPSRDNTRNIIFEHLNKNKKIKLLCLSRRFGQPLSVMAGIKNCTGDRCVVIDCDLQDPPELILDLYKKMDEGYDVVTAKRENRDGETFIKKIITKFGYFLINNITEIKIPKNTGDFRIISKRVLNELKKIDDKSAFLRGLVSYIGFDQTFILYNRDKRHDGKSKYNKYFGSLKIAMNGIVGFSSKPLFIILIFGLLLFGIGVFSLVIKLIFSVFINDIKTPLNLITQFIMIIFGINFLSIGLLGQYIARIYDEVKKQPSYIIEKKVNFDNEN